MRNRPENSLAWEVKPSEINGDWFAAGYILRGPKCGEFAPVHHWADRRDAEAHVMFLNRGISRDKAKAMVMALIHQEVDFSE